MNRTYYYRLELNGKRVESGVVAKMESARSAALYNAKELHNHENKLYMGHEGENDVQYLGTCQPDGTYTDSFGATRKIDEDGRFIK